MAKELIQNADDAGARCIDFCLDERQHGTASLLGPGLAPLQGPALMVHNDAMFNEGDFRSISNIGDSIKRAQDGKTGLSSALLHCCAWHPAPYAARSCVAQTRVLLHLAQWLTCLSQRLPRSSHCSAQCRVAQSKPLRAHRILSGRRM